MTLSPEHTNDRENLGCILLLRIKKGTLVIKNSSSSRKFI